jgi:ribonuclease J
VPFFQKTPGIVLAVYSPMNIDRVVSLYKAANISKRLFVVDLYAAEILKTVRNTIPRPGHNWPDVKVFIPDYQRQMIKKYRAFDRINWVRNHRIFPNDLKSMKNIVIIFRERMAAELEKSDCLKGAGLLWSMWDGYLQKKPFWNEFASRHSMEIHHAHCSGHATITDIKRLVRAVNPRVIVPMHTQAPYKFKNMFSNVQVHEDREWWGAE